MEDTVLGLLEKLGTVDVNLGDFGLSGAAVPGLSDVSQVVSGVSNLLNLRPAAEEYFLLFSDGVVAGVPTFKGLAQFMKQALPVPKTETSVAASGISIAGGWDAEEGEVALRVRLEAGTDKSLVSFGGAVSATIGDMDKLQVLFDLLQVSPPGGQ
eukprot:TRINITY_DN1666_c1_g1_i3.p2 TRINITY_DN1666_c1_g1~~TRINITY_DN1666_c1_g1_i3.p2  ORF type:complete len:155 (+),score=73.05 TRINITY_DN1666_c1_g1_i3:438-902(+)